MVDKYLEKLYSGFLGMNVGIRLGAPVEPTIWTYERIRDTYGDIHGYVKDFINFAADDDANGPVFFIRALLDDASDRELTPEDVGRAWLNYAREGIGMFWWGGYGVSTEHTAYLNLKNGIKPPVSGSIAQNGIVMAEQIGGQIFIDTFGLVSPGNPDMAAKLGEIVASVSHDGNGIYGARFMCAAISAAFTEKTVLDIIDAGLKQIPEDCTYSRVFRAVMDFFEKNDDPSDRDSWRACMDYLMREWGYDKYPGVCHIIPNAGVCAMALLYGRGNFDRTVEIASMAGWDTDCNAGNVGTIIGVYTGLEGISDIYRKPINDAIVCSGISGYLNILDIPSFCKETALIGYRLMGEEAPESITDSLKPGEIHFDFNLPGSTHGFRINDDFLSRIGHSDKIYKTGSGSLEVILDRLTRDNKLKLFYKSFYRRKDFSDERYSPVFSPTVYPGQTVTMDILLSQWNGWREPMVAPYLRTSSDGCDHIMGYKELINDEWLTISFTVPECNGDVYDEVGIYIESQDVIKSKTLGAIYIDSFTVEGKSAYTLDVAAMSKELATVTPFSVDHGAWDISDDSLTLMRCEPAFAYTGAYYARDYEVSSMLTPLNGTHHFLIARAQGAMRFYAAGFSEDKKACIIKNDFGYSVLAECDFDWEKDCCYNVAVKVSEDSVTLSVDGKVLLEVKDDTFAYGMWGMGSTQMGRTAYRSFEFKEI